MLIRKLLLVTAMKAIFSRKVLLLAAMKAIFWAFMGIRKSRDHKQDVARLKPLHVLIAAIIGGSIFITILVVVVKLVVKNF